MSHARSVVPAVVRSRRARTAAAAASLVLLGAALAACDEKQFSTAIAEFDSLTRLDTWKTNMLLRVKRRLQARQAGEDAGAGSEDELL